ncbi:hypothetical protein HUJ05_011785 [Dendroctonus ponderosae]|nr:hypothetical protein HUJ05_011785 [Dendroctonus ponderosae]
MTQETAFYGRCLQAEQTELSDRAVDLTNLSPVSRAEAELTHEAAITATDRKACKASSCEVECVLWLLIFINSHVYQLTKYSGIGFSHSLESGLTETFVLCRRGEKLSVKKVKLVASFSTMANIQEL